MIWVDDDGHVMAKSFTILGEVAFHGLLPDHKMGQEIGMDDLIHPDDFFKQMPPNIRIGARDPLTGQIHLHAGLASLN